MDPSFEKQTQIDQQREDLIARYPAIWDTLIADWESTGGKDRSWLMYSANYLFCTQEVRWAMDPLELNNRIPTAPAMDVARDLKDLDFVLLTHRHKDHLDLGLVYTLRNFPIIWVVPEAILPLVLEETGLPAKQILVPKSLQPIDLHGLRITPFNGLHWENAPGYPEGRRGVPATGYLVEQNGKRMLFPGDTRNYDQAGLPAFGPVDILFSHLWLGREAALQPHLPLLVDFCRFCLALQPRRIILAHLEEWGRQVLDFWDLEHTEQAVSILKKQAPFLPVEVARIGEKIMLAKERKIMYFC
jgi:L-ascorbate metabolism protein UlaG (beta-lactamase superfamily)